MASAQRDRTSVFGREFETEDAHRLIDLTAPTVAVLGLGYVGLPTALGLADAGSAVIGVDVSADRLAAIKDLRADLTPADRERLAWALEEPDFMLTQDLAALADADYVFICVPTPVDEHQAPDLFFLQAACSAAVDHATVGQTIVLTSTSYVGTTRDLLVTPLEQRGLVVGREVFVAFSPERIDPGNASRTQESVPRVVGGATADCTRRAAALIQRVAPAVHQVSSPEAAEMTKLYENIFRAVNIALANELADVAGELRLDATEIIDAASTKPYGFMPFMPGPGAGGHCIPCDPHYILWQLRRDKVRMPVVEQAMDSLAARPRQVVERAAEVLSDAGLGLRGARILVVGVTYKPGVEDIRESPALEIIERLEARGVHVAYYDEKAPRLVLPGGRTMASVSEPWTEPWTLVLVHTAHESVDHSWIADCDRVLDATYQLEFLPQRAVL